MSDFFRGWRRKAGCVTLLMACVMCAAWVRSGVKYDFISFIPGKTTYRIGSFDGAFKFIFDTPRPDAVRRPSRLLDWNSADLYLLAAFQVDENGIRTRLDRWHKYEVVWRWDGAGFHFGAGTQGKSVTSMYEFPYAVLVIPITMISAYLILSKPRLRPAT